jgi:hypothetical protein
MRRLIATAAVCGVSLFGATAVAGAFPQTTGPNPSDQGVANGSTACGPILAHNQAIQLNDNKLGVNIFYNVGDTFGCFGQGE